MAYEWDNMGLVWIPKQAKTFEREKRAFSSCEILYHNSMAHPKHSRPKNLLQKPIMKNLDIWKEKQSILIGCEFMPLLMGHPKHLLKTYKSNSETTYRKFRFMKGKRECSQWELLIGCEFMPPLMGGRTVTIRRVANPRPS